MKTIQEQAIESMVPDLFQAYFYQRPTGVKFDKKNKSLLVESFDGNSMNFELNFDKKKNEIISEGSGERYRDAFEAFCMEVTQEIKGLRIIKLNGSRQ